MKHPAFFPHSTRGCKYQRCESSLLNINNSACVLPLLLVLMYYNNNYNNNNIKVSSIQVVYDFLAAYSINLERNLAKILQDKKVVNTTIERSQK